MKGRALPSLVLIVLGLLLQWLSTPPGPLPWLVLVSDVPFLALLFIGGGRQWKRWVVLYALLHYALGFHWLARIHPVQVIGATAFLVPLMLLAGALIRFCVRRGTSLLLVAPIVLVFEEMARTVYMGGMPLPSRAVPCVAAWPQLASAAALVGAYGFVFLVGASSAWWFEVLAGRGRLVRRSLVWVGAVLVLVGYGSWRNDHLEGVKSTGTDVLLAVQGNIPQDLKHSTNPDASNEMFQTHLRLTEEGLRDARANGERTFVVMWPETMVPWPFLDAELSHRYPDDWENEVRVVRNVRMSAFTDPEPPLVLLGVIHLFRRGDEVQPHLAAYGNHDSLLLVDPKAVSTPGDRYPEPPPIGSRPAWDLGRHDKHVLVPGGEYTPLGDVIVPLRWFRNYVSVIPELDPGAVDQEPFEVRPADADLSAIRAGTVICFELLFPARCRHWRRQGAHVLLNTANYGWFEDSAFRPQIRAVAALRAAETATTVVIAGNTGPTLFVDPRGQAYGRFVDAIDGPQEDVESDANTLREGWATGPLLVDHEPTPYVRWGDWPWWVLGILLLLRAILRAPRSHDAPVTVPAYDGCRSEREGENL